jgi:hypothetical protein
LDSAPYPKNETFRTLRLDIFGKITETVNEKIINDSDSEDEIIEYKKEEIKRSVDLNKKADIKTININNLMIMNSSNINNIIDPIM